MPRVLSPLYYSGPHLAQNRFDMSLLFPFVSSYVPYFVCSRSTPSVYALEPTRSPIHAIAPPLDSVHSLPGACRLRDFRLQRQEFLMFAPLDAPLPVMLESPTPEAREYYHFRDFRRMFETPCDVEHQMFAAVPRVLRTLAPPVAAAMTKFIPREIYGAVLALVNPKSAFIGQFASLLMSSMPFLCKLAASSCSWPDAISLAVSHLATVVALDTTLHALFSNVLLQFSVAGLVGHQSPSLIAELHKHLSAFNGSVTACSHLKPLLLKIFRWVLPNWYFHYVRETDREQFDRWCLDVEDLASVPGSTFSVPNRRRAHTLIIQSDAFLLDCNNERLDPNLRTMFRTLHASIAKIRARLHNRSEVRTEPFCFCLVGAPGVGKSAIVSSLGQILASAHLATLGVEIASSDVLVYNRGHGDHYDSYTGQPVTVLDDLWAEAANTSKENDFLDMISCNPMILPMADLADKGQNFVSVIVGVTTNNAYPRPAGQITPEALHRRRHALIQCRIHPDHPVTEPGYRDFAQFAFAPSLRRAFVPEWLSRDELVRALLVRSTAHFAQQKTRETSARALHEMYAQMKDEDFLGTGPDVFVDVEPPLLVDDAEHQMFASSDTSPIRPPDPAFSPTALPWRSQPPSPTLFGDTYHAQRDGIYFPYGLDPNTSNIINAVSTITAPDYACGSTSLREAVLGPQALANARRRYKRDQCQWYQNPSVESGDRPESNVFPSTLSLLADAPVTAMHSLLDFLYDLIRSLVAYFSDLTCAPTPPLVELAFLRPARAVANHWTTAFEAVKRTMKAFTPCTETLFFIGSALAAIPLIILGVSYFGKSKDEPERELPPKAPQPVVSDAYDQTGGFYEYPDGEPRRMTTGKLNQHFRAMQQGGAYDSDDGPSSVHFEKDGNPNPLISSLRARSLLAFVTNTASGAASYGTALGVGGSAILMNYHYLNDKPTRFIFISSTQAEFPIELNASSAVRLINWDQTLSDLCLVHVPSLNLAQRISCFASDSELQSKFATGSAFCASTLSTATHRVGESLKPANISTSLVRPVSALNHGDGSSKIQTCILSYSGETERGWCGAVLINNRSSRIYGMHTAGSAATKTGFACVVSSEMLQTARTSLYLKYGVKSCATYAPDDVLPHAPRLILESSGFEQAALLPHVVFQSTKTSLAPSPISGVFPITHGPSVLTDCDKRCLVKGSILIRGLAKYSGPTPIMKQSELREAVDTVLMMMDHPKSKMFKRFGVESMDDMAVVNGRGSMENGQWTRFIGYEPIDVTTSAGYPFSKWPDARKSHHIFSTEFLPSGQALHHSTPAFLRVVDQMEADLKRGVRPDAYFTGTLKDECRKLAKIEQGATRVFMASSKSLVYLSRKYLADFIAWMHVAHCQIFSTVGINPNGPMWTWMFNQLMQKSDVGFAGDYTNWDGSLSAELIMACAEVVNKWYADSPLNQEIRRGIFQEMAFSRFVVCNGVYRKNRGMPSGCVGTSEFNCIINQMVFLIAWQRLATLHQPGVRGMHRYSDHVLSYFYGDDNISAVSRDTPWFNAVNVSGTLAELGLTLTSEDKDAELLRANTSLDKLSFLKRRFVVDGAFVRCPIEIVTIRNMVNFIRTGGLSPPPWEALRANAKAALVECFQHGRQVYDEHASAIASAFAEHGESCVPVTYDGVRSEWLECQSKEVSALDGILWISSSHVGRSFLRPTQCDGPGINIGQLCRALG
jgi:hypothetical protein